MVEIADERVTRVWSHGCEKYGHRLDLVRRHMALWILALKGKSPNESLPPIELVWNGGTVIGVRADV